MSEPDPRLLSAEQLAAMREHWLSSGRKDPESLGAKLSQRGDFRVLLFDHLDALRSQLAAAEAREGRLAEACLAYDKAILRCGRPSHLLTGTHADNSADMVREERQIQGILAPKAKLAPWQVRAIRAAYRPNEVTLEQLGDLFGVTKQSVKSVVDYETWRSVS